MIQLPNGCSCSAFNVHPQNWKSPRASLKKDWYITYRFYDPLYRNHPKYLYGKLVMLKGMNHFTTREARQQGTAAIIERELDRLQNKAYNPITGYSNDQVPTAFIIEPLTPFIEALTKAEKRIQAAASTKRDLRSILHFVTKASEQLRFERLPVSRISRKHIKLLLTQVETTQTFESPHRYNKIRTYLMLLFNELVDLEAVDFNPVKDIAKKKGVIRLRKLLSDDQRNLIDAHLKAHHYRFWLFTQIFFHSGARLTEMMQVKKEEVDLQRQVFKVTVRKGQLRKEVEKPIKHVALPFWEEVLKDAEASDYLFSRKLKPGPVPVQSYQITKRWNKYVKKELGIAEDFYSLKHLNLDETAALLDIQAAAIQASHTSTHITVRHYAVNEYQRQLERLKGIENPFSKPGEEKK